MHLAQIKLLYLANKISRQGIATNPHKTEVVEPWPTPKSVKDTQKLFRLASYYRCFVKNIATIARPLTRLTKCDLECQQTFDSLKEKLVSSPMLSYPNFSFSFSLETDASNYFGIASVLSQVNNGKEVVIAYSSKTFLKRERTYSSVTQILSCEH